MTFLQPDDINSILIRFSWHFCWSAADVEYEHMLGSTEDRPEHVQMFSGGFKEKLILQYTGRLLQKIFKCSSKPQKCSFSSHSWSQTIRGPLFWNCTVSPTVLFWSLHCLIKTHEAKNECSAQPLPNSCTPTISCRPPNSCTPTISCSPTNTCKCPKHLKWPQTPTDPKTAADPQSAADPQTPGCAPNTWRHPKHLEMPQTTADPQTPPGHHHGRYWYWGIKTSDILINCHKHFSHDFWSLCTALHITQH